MTPSFRPRLDIAYQMAWNHYNGLRTLQLELAAWLPVRVVGFIRSGGALSEVAESSARVLATDHDPEG